jgi:Na+/H+ antiporter NhaD/arsenite permease-like protein
VTPASVSLLALVVAILVSCTARVNVGILALALAWGVGLYTGAGAELVTASFPAGLFLTLAGVTLLFALTEVNGTIDRVAAVALRLARGDARLLPWLLFLIAGAISSVGPGAIASVALVAPMGMAVGQRSGRSPFLTALAVANGANAGNLSPVSAVGVIANTKIVEAGLGSHSLKVWAANFLAHVLVTALAYVALGAYRAGGPRSGARGDDAGAPTGSAAAVTRAAAEAKATAGTGLSRGQWLTVTVVGAWILGVVVWRWPLGASAFAAALALILLGAADEAAALKRLPWSAVIMVTGMSLLVTAVEKTGGLELFTALLARLATPASVNGVIAFVTGLISTYSSTSGVVLPTFLPTVPGLVERLGGGEPLAIALSINVGASLVDVSPLSTLGALCVAAVASADATDLFRKLMVWGLSMSLAGALLCQLFAGSFARL